MKRKEGRKEKGRSRRGRKENRCKMGRLLEIRSINKKLLVKKLDIDEIPDPQLPPSVTQHALALIKKSSIMRVNETKREKGNAYRYEHGKNMHKSMYITFTSSSSSARRRALQPHPQLCHHWSKCKAE